MIIQTMEKADDHVGERLRRAAASSTAHHELEIGQGRQCFGAAQCSQRIGQIAFRQHRDGEAGVERSENAGRARALEHHGPRAARAVELVERQLPPAESRRVQCERRGLFTIELHRFAGRPDASFATQ